MRSPMHWTPQEDQFLKENVSKLLVKEMADILGRTANMVHYRKCRLGLRAGRSIPFTTEEVDIIRTHYSDIGAIGVCKLINRTHGAIKRWASINGLRVSQKFKSETAIRVNKSWTRSAETKKKIGDGHRKYPQSVCEICGKKTLYRKRCRDCYRLTCSGEGGNNWKGGVSSLSSMIHQLLWPVWKYPILARDNFQCQCCGATGTLHVHHLRRYVEIRDGVISDHKELNLSNFYDRKKIAELIILRHTLDDGITLCPKCHAQIHRKKPGELRGTLTVKDEGNPQPSQSNVRSIVDWKVQRLTGEDSQANKPDTSARPLQVRVMR